jgi:hypothetical protein
VYDVATNAWTKLVPTAIEARWGHRAAASADRMFVWGGFNIGNAPLRTGGIYNPAK